MGSVFPRIAKLAAELLGTSMIAFTVAVSGGHSSSATAVAVGCAVTAAVYAGGHVSGGMYNPAITMAAWLRGSLDFGECCGYMATQLLGGFLGGVSGMVLFVSPETGFIGRPVLGDGVSDGSAVLAELVLTAALCHTFLHVATTEAQADNSYHGLAVGCAVTSGMLSIGAFSNCLNPALAMLTLVHKGQVWAHSEFAAFSSIETGADKVWIHVVGPFVGSIAAAFLFRLTHPREQGYSPGDKSWIFMFFKSRESAAPILLEFVGVFLLSFTYACATCPANDTGLAAVAIGSMLVAQVYTCGSTSGAHLNPAVTIAVLARRKLAEIYKGGETFKERFVAPLAAMFVLAQCVAALCGGGVARGVTSQVGFPAPMEGLQDGRAFWGELVATTFVAYVFLHAVTSDKTAGHAGFGLAAGSAVAAMTAVLHTSTGAALNPAVALLGLTAKADDDFSAQHKIWIYFLTGPVAGVLAGLLFHSISYDEVDPAYSILRKTTALATLNPATRQHHAYFAREAPPPGAGAPVRLQSNTQGEFVLTTPRGAHPPPNGPPSTRPLPDGPPPSQRAESHVSIEMSTSPMAVEATTDH